MINKLTNLDNAQIVRYSYDENKQAQRVTVVDLGIGEAIKEAFSKIELPKLEIQASTQAPSEPTIYYVDKIVKEIEKIEIEKNIFIPKLEIIEKPVIVKEIEIVKVPEYITIQKTEIIEKPVIIKEYEQIPNIFKYSIYLLLFLECVNLIKSLMK